MKKLSLLIPILLAPFIVSCDNVEKDNSLIFTEFCVGNIFEDRAVEITNISSNTIDLSNYTICNYRTMSGQDTPTEVISLSGELESGKTFVIVPSDASETYKNKADMLTDKLLNIGGFSMSIKYKNNYIVDALGNVGISSDIAKNADLVRKQEYFVPRGKTYVEYDWIRYVKNYTENLGNTNCISEYELLLGPKLTAEDLNKPFTDSTAAGTGGTAKVTLGSTVDGDTTRFNFGSSYSGYGVKSNESVRYYGINTPEIAHGVGEVADPFGNEARDYTNGEISSASKFIVQSIAGYSLRETYDRLLGYVWISYYSSPTPEQYELMSFKIVLNGFAKVSFTNRGEDFNNLMQYKGIQYIEYLYNAENYAKKNKLNIHSL